MSSLDNEHRPHLPMRNGVAAGFRPCDAKDADMISTPIDQLRPPAGALDVPIVLVGDRGLGPPC